MLREERLLHPSFPCCPTEGGGGLVGDGVEIGEGGREKWERSDGRGAVGASHCDQRTNRWYIVFALAYHNLRLDHDALICRVGLSVCLCEGAAER